MSITPMSLRHYTVSQLREKAKEVAPLSTGFSRMRKAELIDFIVRASETAVPFVSQDDVETIVVDALPARTIDVPAVGTFDANAFLAAVGSRLAAGFSEQDRRDYDMVKYRGRYEGKRALVEIGTERVHGETVPRYATGTIVAGSSRRELLASDLETGNGTLVLTVRHDGLPRATMHRAEDIVLV